MSAAWRRRCSASRSLLERARPAQVKHNTRVLQRAQEADGVTPRAEAARSDVRRPAPTRRAIARSGVIASKAPRRSRRAASTRAMTTNGAASSLPGSWRKLVPPPQRGQQGLDRATSSQGIPSRSTTCASVCSSTRCAAALRLRRPLDVRRRRYAVARRRVAVAPWISASVSAISAARSGVPPPASSRSAWWATTSSKRLRAVRALPK